MNSAITPEQWINLLSEFGPCAFFIFMFFVGLWIARQKVPTPEQQRAQNIAYAVVWVSIFVFAGLSTIVFWRANFPTEQCIHGYIRGLSDPEFFSTSDDIFLKRIVRASVAYDYEFRMINPSKDVQDVKLLFQSSPGDLHSALYTLPLERDFDRSGKKPVEFQFDQASKCLSFHQKSGAFKKVCATDASALALQSAPPSHGLSFGLPVVHAAMFQAPNVDGLVRALDANDPVIRENARRQLLASGAAGKQQIVNALAAPGSSQRLRYEAIRTLNLMPPVNGSALPQGARCTIMQLSRSSDPLVSREAAMLLQRSGSGLAC